MPRLPIDYSRTIIYKIMCLDPTIDDIYIGHTTDLTKRKYQHKNRYNGGSKFKLYNFIRDNNGWDNFRFVMIESFPCDNKNEASKREGYWIDSMKPSLNMCAAGIGRNETTKRYRQRNQILIKEYYQKNEDKFRERRKNYYQKNKDIVLQKQKEYREKNEDKYQEWGKNYYQKNSDTIKIRAKKWVEDNPDKCKERKREYYQKNKDRIREQRKEFREKNKDKLKEKSKEYREKNKDKLKEKSKEKSKEYLEKTEDTSHIYTTNILLQ